MRQTPGIPAADEAQRVDGSARHSTSVMLVAAAIFCIGVLALVIFLRG
ncbi:hypothetical protein [Phenylobacterium sp.]|jgi:hypothetical protein